MLKMQNIDKLFEMGYDIDDNDEKLSEIILHANMETDLRMIDYQSFSYQEAVRALEQIFYYSSDEAETYDISYNGEVHMYNAGNLLYEVNRNGDLQQRISSLKSSRAKKFL